MPPLQISTPAFRRRCLQAALWSIVWAWAGGRGVGAHKPGRSVGSGMGAWVATHHWVSSGCVSALASVSVRSSGVQPTPVQPNSLPPY